MRHALCVFPAENAPSEKKTIYECKLTGAVDGAGVHFKIRSTEKIARLGIDGNAGDQGNLAFKAAFQILNNRQHVTVNTLQQVLRRFQHIGRPVFVVAFFQVRQQAFDGRVHWLTGFDH